MDPTRRTVITSIATGLAAAGQTGGRRELPAEALSKFGPAARDQLTTTVSGPDYRGQLEAATVNELLRLEKKSVDQLMLDLLPLARLGSHAPLSNFHVGAVIQGNSKNLYLGANIEAAGQSLGLAVHGEQAAIGNAYMQGENGVTALAVTAAPCGHCRQFLTEMVPDGNLRILFISAPATKLATLLPQAFSPKDLGRNEGAFPIPDTPLSLAEQPADKVVAAALHAARRAYAPYSQSPSGVGIQTSSGRIFAGSYIENVAFNPSLSPLQTALAGLFAAGVSAGDVARAVLVEAEDAHISQRASTEATLAAMAPAARFEILPAKRM